jgi:hypothetical protein
MSVEANAIASAQEGAAPPAETASPAVDQVTSGATPTGGAIADAPDGARPSRAQERIEELNARAKAATEYGEFYRQRFEELQRQQSQQPAPAAAPTVEQAAPEPNADDFDDPKEYTKVHATWVRAEAAKEIKRAVQEATATAKTEAEKALVRSREEERLRTLNDGFGLRQQQFAEKNPDYWDAVRNPALTFFNGDFLEALKASELGPQIALHIAKDPKVVARLAGKSVPQRLAELGRIEAELSRPAPPPKVTAAPAPPTPIGGGAGGQVDPSKLSIDDWMKHRTQQILAKRQAR